MIAKLALEHKALSEMASRQRFGGRGSSGLSLEPRRATMTAVYGAGGPTMLGRKHFPVSRK
jgi:hypothetical protein